VVAVSFDELARRLALFTPAPDLGTVALPDLDAGAAGNVEGAAGVEGDPVGVADVPLQADELAVGGEDLQKAAHRGVRAQVGA